MPVFRAKNTRFHQQIPATLALPGRTIANPLTEGFTETFTEGLSGLVQSHRDAQSQRFQNFLQRGQRGIALFRENFVETGPLEAHAPSQTTHAASRFHHVFERNQESSAVVFPQHLGELFGGAFGITQPFVQIIFVVF